MHGAGATGASAAMESLEGGVSSPQKLSVAQAMAISFGRVVSMKTADKFMTFDLHHLAERHKMGQFTTYPEFKRAFGVVRATVQDSMVNERLSLLERGKLVELLRLMDERQSRLDLLENCSHAQGQWKAHAKFISGMLGWHGHDQLSQKQYRQDHKDLEMLLKLHTRGAGGKGFEPGLSEGARDPKGRKKKCWLCNKSGHVAANCTKKGKGGRAGETRSCYKCGKTGHIARNCRGGGSSEDEEEESE